MKDLNDTQTTRETSLSIGVDTPSDTELCSFSLFFLAGGLARVLLVHACSGFAWEVQPPTNPCWLVYHIQPMFISYVSLQFSTMFHIPRIIFFMLP